MNYLLSLVHQTDSPLLIAFLLGVVFLLDPCAVLTNIAAIGYIGREITSVRKVFVNGLWYTLGRVVAFCVLGGVFMILLQTGANVLHMQSFFENYGELLLIPFFLIMGVLIVFSDLLPAFKWSFVSEKLERRLKQNAVGSFLMGAVLSLALCPTNAIIFFVMLVPLAATQSFGGGLLLLIVFSVTVALSVLVISWILAFSYDGISRFYHSISHYGKWFRWAVGLFFIILGCYFLFEYLHETSCSCC